MNELFRNIRAIIEDEIRLGTKNFIIYPFSDVGHLVKEILELDYGRKPMVVDNLLSKYNSSIYSTDIFSKVEPDSVVLLSVGNLEGQPYFMRILDAAGVRYQNVHEILRTLHIPEKEAWFRELAHLLAVREVSGRYKFLRVGRDNDGGYILLDDFYDVQGVYSFGISGDVSFEKDMARRGIDCFMYDHTIDRLPEENKFFHWQKKGIAGVDKPEEKLFALETLMKENGDVGGRNLILKMDVEGAEWEFLEHTSSELLAGFRQIAFELHDVTDMSNDKVMPMLRKLSETHTPVWLHANNYCSAEVAGGIVFASSMEVLYLNNACYEFTMGDVEFPWALDMPNAPEVSEIVLGNRGGTSCSL